MAKPSLIPEEEILTRQIIETMIAGLKEWRPDLSYPESYSDMRGMVFALLRMFEVSRRPTAKPLSLPCPKCGGIGIMIDPSSSVHFRKCETCDHCQGRRKVPFE